MVERRLLTCGKINCPPAFALGRGALGAVGRASRGSSAFEEAPPGGSASAIPPTPKPNLCWLWARLLGLWCLFVVGPIGLPCDLPSDVLFISCSPELTSLGSPDVEARDPLLLQNLFRFTTVLVRSEKNRLARPTDPDERVFLRSV